MGIFRLTLNRNSRQTRLYSVFVPVCKTNLYSWRFSATVMRLSAVINMANEILSPSFMSYGGKQ